LNLRFGFDLRVVGGSDKTLYRPDPLGVGRILSNEQPNYPAWRVTLGTTIPLIAGTAYRPGGAGDRDLLMQKAQTRRELFEQIIRDQKDAEAADAELQRIKAERLRAEKELERLRRILEGEAAKSEIDQAQETEKVNEAPAMNEDKNADEQEEPEEDQEDPEDDEDE